MAYSTIPKGSLHMNPVIYTGNGGTQSITGVGFKPDMTWLKKRNGTANHHLVDAVRGVGYYVYPNLTNAQGGNGSALLTSFNTDGFTLDSGADSNASGATGVGWSWKAGNLSNGTGVSNTDGSITSTVSANTTSGFSIVSYTGTGANATVGHGLGVAPKMIIVKNEDASVNWLVYHDSIPATNTLILNTTASSASDNAWNSTDPTPNVFSIGVTGSGNGSGQGLIAYCFADIQGFSKMGSYTGNGNANGPFIYTGFKPSFVLWKRTEDAGYDWDLYDTARDTHNVAFKELIPNGSGAESSSTVLSLDILSNGFKLRTSNGNGNDSGKPYIYMAFAENPFVATSGTNAIPVTAR